MTQEVHDGLRARAGAGGLPARAGPGRLRATAADLAATGVPAKATALTISGALCLLAALTALVGLAGMAGNFPGTSEAVLDVLRAVGAGALADTLQSPVDDLFADKQLAVLLLVGGLAATAVLSWSYLRTFRLSAAPLAGDGYTVDPDRGPLPALLRILMAQALVVIALCAIATGPLAQAIGDVAQISDDAVVAWDIVKWPMLLVIAFVVFAALHRSAVADPAVLASSSVAFSQVFVMLVWLIAATGFVLYLVSFGSFQDTYGTVGSAIVLLVWLTMFSMLYYATPVLRPGGIGPLGMAAAISALTWLVSCAALAVCVGTFDALANGIVATVTGIVFVIGVWLSNMVLLLGVRLNARAAPAAIAPAPAVPPAPAAAPATPSGADAEDLFAAVSRALQNDVAHDTMLSPVDTGTEAGGSPRLSDLELDLSDWGFTYGVAWATARAEDPSEPDASVAERALGAANRVFRIYCGDPQWSARIRAQTSGYGDTARPVIALPTSNGDAKQANGHDPLRLSH